MQDQQQQQHVNDYEINYDDSFYLNDKDKTSYTEFIQNIMLEHLSIEEARKLLTPLLFNSFSNNYHSETSSTDFILESASLEFLLFSTNPFQKLQLNSRNIPTVPISEEQHYLICLHYLYKGIREYFYHSQRFLLFLRPYCVIHHKDAFNRLQAIIDTYYLKIIATVETCRKLHEELVEKNKLEEDKFHKDFNFTMVDKINYVEISEEKNCCCCCCSDDEDDESDDNNDDSNHVVGKTKKYSKNKKGKKNKKSKKR